MVVLIIVFHPVGKNRKRTRTRELLFFFIVREHSEARRGVFVVNNLFNNVL